MKVGPWVLVEDGCGATRVIEGGNVNNIKDRVAFIEKTPRIRIRPYYLLEKDKDFLNWASGPFKGSGPEDEEARAWCDRALVLFGYTLES